MAFPGSRINTSELFKCMLALCLDENNFYRLQYRGIPEGRKDEFMDLMVKEGFVIPKKEIEYQILFGMGRNTLSNSVVLPEKKNNRGTFTGLLNAITRFRKVYLKLFPESELQYLDPVTKYDFDPESIQNDDTDREELLYEFGAKMGYCKLREDNSGFLLKNGKVEVERMAVVKTVDRKKNIANKPGYGVQLSPEVTEKLLKKYQGVYALYYPAAFRNTEKEGYFTSAMRVSHTLEEDNQQSSVVRIKLNIPNVTHPEARYQYRGYLTPIGHDDHLHLLFYLATNTINREEFLPDAPALDKDTVSIICRKMIGMDQVFRGILTSLSQREPECSRLPYGAEVLIQRQIFNGNPEEIRKSEREFMQQEGLGYFGTLEDLLDNISERREASSVKRFFDESGSNQLIYSEPFI